MPKHMKKILLIALICYTPFLFAQLILDEDFESNNVFEEPPASWVCDANGWLAGEGIQNHGREPHTGDWYAYLKWDSDHWMFKEITLEAGELYEFNMWYKTDGSEGFTMEVSWGNNADANSMSSEIIPLTAVNNDFYLEAIGSFTASTSGTFYLGIHGAADNNPWYLMVDDIILRKVQAYDFMMYRLNPDTLIQAGSSHDYRLEIENIGVNEDIIDLTYTSAWDAEFFLSDGVTSISSVNLASFESETILLRQSVPAAGVNFGQIESTDVHANSQNSSATQSTQILSTALTPIEEFPLEEGFELELFPPLGWYAHIENGSRNFERISEGEYPTCFPHDDSEAMAYYKSFSAQEGHSASLVSPELVLAASDYVVRFWVFRTDNINNKADKFEVYIADDPNMGNAQLLGTIHRVISMSPEESSEGWFEYSFDFDGSSINKHIIIRAVSAYGWNMYLDDIRILEDSPDLEAPEFVSINELEQYADLDLPVEIVIRDDSEVTENMEGVYNVGNGDEYFQVTQNGKSKGDFPYSGFIPAHPDGTTGTVKFIMEDIHGNTAETESFEIQWNGVAPLLEESFEEEFLPPGWEQIMQPLTWFVWVQENTEDYEDSDGVQYTVVPPHGDYQAMVGWDWQGNVQDEWLISPPVEITDLADLSFETFAQLGSYDYDHFIVAISVNGGAYQEVWDAFYMENRVIQYDETISIPLDEYQGEVIRVAWRAYNQMYDNLWYAWFVDDVRIEKREVIAIEELSENKAFDFRILQNPCQDLLKIQITNPISDQAEFRLIDLQGRVIKAQSLNALSEEPSHHISTSDLQNGIYLCEIIMEGQRMSKRVLKVD